MPGLAVEGVASSMEDCVESDQGAGCSAAASALQQHSSLSIISIISGDEAFSDLEMKAPR